LLCHGSVGLVQKCPATTSDYADQGTVAHHIGALCLQDNFASAEAYKGRVFQVMNSVLFAGIGERPPRLRGQTKDFVSIHEVDDDMVCAVNTYVSRMRNYAFASECFMREQPLDISGITGEEGATGTADAIIIKGNSLQVHDYKHGRGKKVRADSSQLAIYGLAALSLAETAGFEPTTVQCFIHQPRVRNDHEHHEWSVKKLRAYGEVVRQSADRAMTLWKEGKETSDLNPGSEQCFFCDAKPTCPALRKEVAKTCFDDFDALAKEVPVAMPSPETEEELLSLSLSKIGMIEKWCEAVKAEAYRRVVNGVAVPRYKLVKGKGGNRAWADEAKTAKVLTAAGLTDDTIYVKKLITPPVVEKLLKQMPSVWKALQAHITRPEGAPTLVPESDNRPALTVGAPADDFDAAT